MHFSMSHRFGPAAAAADQYLKKHGLLEKGFVAVHWRSEKIHPDKRSLWALEDSTNRIAYATIKALKLCGLNYVYFGIDFSKFGTSSMRTKGDRVDHMFKQLERITHELEQKGYTVLLFDAYVDYPRAASAGNGMAVAAAELTIMSRASLFVPLVKSGSFVQYIEMEATQNTKDPTTLTEYVRACVRVWGHLRVSLYSSKDSAGYRLQRGDKRNQASSRSKC